MRWQTRLGRGHFNSTGDRLAARLLSSGIFNGQTGYLRCIPLTEPARLLTTMNEKKIPFNDFSADVSWRVDSALIWLPVAMCGNMLIAYKTRTEASPKLSDTPPTLLITSCITRRMAAVTDAADP
jgi:hypothetical protein